MNWWLIIVAIIGVILTIGVALYLVVLYCSEDDKNQAWLPKIIVVAGLSLAAFTVLLLPYDVANRKDPEIMDSAGGGINTAVCWQIVLWCIAAMVLVVTPFATFYYESWDPDQSSSFEQVKPALGYTFATLFIFLLLFIILWFTVGKAALDYEGFSSPPTDFDLENWKDSAKYFTGDKIPCFCDAKGTTCSGDTPISPEQSTCSQLDGTLTIKVSAFVYIVGLLCAIGWLTFVVFGGVGLIALPMDLINDWRMRPEKMSLTEYNQKKKALAEEVSTLLETGKKLESQQEAGKTGLFGSLKKKINKFKESVNEIEKRYQRLEASRDVNQSIIMAWLKLPIGILGVVVSLLWVLHIIIFNLTGAHPFLNNMFIGLDKFFPVFGTCAYAVFAIWMLWAAVKGCFKMGCNFGIIQIHPMKVNGTLMSSFLFNVMLIQLTAVTVTQFCAMSFRTYAANTAVDGIFTTYVNNLQGIGYIMRYFQIALLIFSGLAFVYLLFKPWCCPKKDFDDDDD